MQVVGHASDILNLGGVKVSILAMDDALRALPGVADAMCFDQPVQGRANSFLASTKVVKTSHFFRTPEMPGHSAVEFRMLPPEWLCSDGPGTENLAPTVVGPEAPWMYPHTSGTPGEPKFIPLNQRMVRDRCRAAEGDIPKAATTFACFFGCTARPFLARALAAERHRLRRGRARPDGPQIGRRPLPRRIAAGQHG